MKIMIFLLLTLLLPFNFSHDEKIDKYSGETEAFVNREIEYKI